MQSNSINIILGLFMPSGILPSQYYHFCRLASLGTVEKRYTDSGNTSCELHCSTVSVFTIVYKYVAAIESYAKHQ